MLSILSLTAPIFLLIFAGFLCVRFGLLPKEALPGMSRFVLMLALPMMMFLKISQLDIQEVINFDYLMVYTLACVGSYLGVFGLSRYLLKESTALAGIKGFGSSFSNSAFIGLPLLLQFYEDAPTQAFVMALVVENIILFPLILGVFEISSNKGTRYSALFRTVSRRLITNPIILAVIAGVAASLLKIQLPTVLITPMELVAASAASLALIIIGGTLAGTVVIASLKDVVLLSGVKLIVTPALVVLMVVFMVPDLDPMLKVALVIFTSAPMMSMFPIISGQYGDQNWCSGILLATTALSFFTIPLMLSVVNSLL